MIKSFLWIPCVMCVCSLAITNPSYKPVNGSLKDSTASTQLTNLLFNQYVHSVFETASLQISGLDIDVFKKAVTGYYNLKLANKLTGNSSLITIVDLAKSSCTKRLWIVDLQNKKLVLTTWVAHGQRSGEDIPNHFSNDIDSYESSLGFYVTDNVYMGKHGRSLRLNGMDEGFNDNANTRDIVLHAASYVCAGAIRDMGRLGRSQGCPAVAPQMSNRIIDMIKGKNVLFINGTDDSYTSKYLNPEMAARTAFQDNGEDPAKLLL